MSSFGTYEPSDAILAAVKAAEWLFLSFSYLLKGLV